MPLYEYVCRDCQERFERYLRSWNEDVRCPACRGERVEKQLSTFAFAGFEPRTATVGGGGGCGCGRGGCGCGH